MGRKFEIEEQDYLKKLGKVLRKCRKDKSQIDVSKEIHISATDISRYENGTKNIDILTLRKFCNYYKRDMTVIISAVQGKNDTPLNEKLDSLKTKVDRFSSEAYQIIRDIKNMPKQ